MKTNIQIKSWSSGEVLFEHKTKGNTIRKTVERAVQEKANLRGANLRDADLQCANLRGANLRGANLQNAKNIDSDMADFWWHIHHEKLVEQLTEPIRARINYIKKEKPEDEVKLRLKLLKPVLGKIPNTQKGWERLHKKECKNCPWDGKTIFPGKNEL